MRNYFLKKGVQAPPGARVPEDYVVIVGQLNNNLVVTTSYYLILLL